MQDTGRPFSIRSFASIFNRCTPSTPTPWPASARLELQARQTVEGFITGGHRSKQHGFAVEFAQHREYVPGDDIRHVDWKVYGRTERFYLKQYELETNLVCWLLVDASESMRYGSGRSHQVRPRLHRAAASLGYLVVQQTDSVGLATFDSQVRQFLRPASQPTHLKDVCRLLVGGASDREVEDRPGAARGGRPVHPPRGGGGVQRPVRRPGRDPGRASST